MTSYSAKAAFEFVFKKKAVFNPSNLKITDEIHVSLGTVLEGSRGSLVKFDLPCFGVARFLALSRHRDGGDSGKELPMPSFSPALHLFSGAHVPALHSHVWGWALETPAPLPTLARSRAPERQDGGQVGGKARSRRRNKTELYKTELCRSWLTTGQCAVRFVLPHLIA